MSSHIEPICLSGMDMVYSGKQNNRKTRVTMRLDYVLSMHPSF